MMTIQPWPTTQQSRHDQIKSLRPPPIQESHPGMKPQHWGCRQKFLKKFNQIEYLFVCYFSHWQHEHSTLVRFSYSLALPGASGLGNLVGLLGPCMSLVLWRLY